MESNKILQWRQWKRYAQGRPPLRRHGFIKSMPLEGRGAPPPWWWCLLGDLCFLCVFFLIRDSSVGRVLPTFWEMLQSEPPWLAIPTTDFCLAKLAIVWSFSMSLSTYSTLATPCTVTILCTMSSRTKGYRQQCWGLYCADGIIRSWTDCILKYLFVEDTGSGYFLSHWVSP